jgi:predicted nucleic acid-binding Zn ribbon protein
VSPRRRRTSKLKEIGGELARVLADLGLEDAQRAFRIGEHWEEAVGSDVARHSRPVALRGDVLEVDVDSSVWAQQLQLQLPTILSALGRALPEGEPPPTDLRFRVGGRGAPR